jgi:hypothetical protein
LKLCACALFFCVVPAVFDNSWLEMFFMFIMFSSSYPRASFAILHSFWPAAAGGNSGGNVGDSCPKFGYTVWIITHQLVAVPFYCPPFWLFKLKITFNCKSVDRVDYVKLSRLQI